MAPIAFLTLIFIGTYRYDFYSILSIYVDIDIVSTSLSLLNFSLEKTDEAKLETPHSTDAKLEDHTETK